MATARSSSESDVDLDEQIDRFDDFYFGDNGYDVEGTVVVAVGSTQPGVAPYRREPAKKHWQSKPVSGVESDAVIRLIGSSLLQQAITTDRHRV